MCNKCTDKDYISRAIHIVKVYHDINPDKFQIRFVPKYWVFGGVYVSNYDTHFRFDCLYHQQKEERIVVYDYCSMPDKYDKETWRDISVGVGMITKLIIIPCTEDCDSKTG